MQGGTASTSSVDPLIASIHIVSSFNQLIGCEIVRSVFAFLEVCLHRHQHTVLPTFSIGNSTTQSVFNIFLFYLQPISIEFQQGLCLGRLLFDVFVFCPVFAKLNQLVAQSGDFKFAQIYTPCFVYDLRIALESYYPYCRYMLFFTYLSIILIFISGNSLRSTATNYSDSGVSPRTSKFFMLKLFRKRNILQCSSLECVGKNTFSLRFKNASSGDSQVNSSISGTTSLSPAATIRPSKGICDLSTKRIRGEYR